MPSDAVVQYLANFLDVAAQKLTFIPLSGGSINKAYCLQLKEGTQYFCKVNSATKFLHLFQKEVNGLHLLTKGFKKVAQPIHTCVVDNEQVLLLEWLTTGQRNTAFWRQFGEQLAHLHTITNSHFGLHENNYMGSVEQNNEPMESWVDFFIQKRLYPLTQKCLQAGLLTLAHTKGFEKVYNRLNDIFNTEKPSLLHGDLWSGNFMCNGDAEPVLIDPAVYYGHRSMDLAMTTLFGGFDAQFYDAYHYHYPLPNNYTEQWQICNLYPLLIHLLLFGKSYLFSIEETVNHYQ